MIDQTTYLASKKRTKAQATRHQQLAVEMHEMMGDDKKYLPQYLRLYRDACRVNLEGELAEIAQRTTALFFEGRVKNRGSYFLSAARNLLNPKKR